jgi:Arc/MetJ family transcription regulator
MRTNIVIDDGLMQKASGLPSKREIVEAGLRLLVQLKQQEKICSARGKLKWSGDLAASRTDKSKK